MWRKQNECTPALVPATGSELSALTATVAKWGMEAGFLGIEGHLEGRVSALVREASVRWFGNCEAGRDLWLCRVESIEKEYDNASRKIADCRQNRDLARRGKQDRCSSSMAHRTDGLPVGAGATPAPKCGTTDSAAGT